ncbi:MAG TPA: hypothetical protein VEN79_06600 [Terriglobia bacterium]|nr:hypothetical protein [Terriglobia bacterium]
MSLFPGDPSTQSTPVLVTGIVLSISINVGICYVIDARIFRKKLDAG